MHNLKRVREVQAPGAFPRSSAHFEARHDPEGYQERTKRNRLWVGGDLGQRRIRDMKIAVAGLGGIGGMIAEALVRAGVGHLRIADLDRIEKSNINRQIAARETSLGRPKSEVMAELLRGLADDYELVVYAQGVRQEMAEEFVEGCDAVIDEIDVLALESKLTLHRVARARGLPIYSAYALGFGIQFYKFQGEDYRLEDFLGSDPWKLTNPSAEYLLDVFGPMPGYLKEDGLIQGIESGGVPIFGPATLLGHSLVSTRVLLDLLGCRLGDRALSPTPLMPEFLNIDLGTFAVDRHRAPRRQ
jgi:molybdopterin/thiamine biosynthesis adenylyltransferase